MRLLDNDDDVFHLFISIMSYFRRYYDVDTHPTVNPHVLAHLRPPWDNRPSTYQKTMYATEYDRQYTWKFPIPKSTTGTATADPFIDRPLVAPMPAVKPAAPISAFRDELTQTGPLIVREKDEAVQTTLEKRHDATQTSAGPSFAEDKTTSTAVQAAELPVKVDASTAMSAEKLDELGEAVDDKPHLRTAAPLFSEEAPKPAVETPARKPAEHQMLSYGYAFKDPYNPDYDMKTFNVTVPEREVGPSLFSS